MAAVELHDRRAWVLALEVEDVLGRRAAVASLEGETLASLAALVADTSRVGARVS